MRARIFREHQISSRFPNALGVGATWRDGHVVVGTSVENAYRAARDILVVTEPDVAGGIESYVTGK